MEEEINVERENINVGGEGTTNYNGLINKPKINGVELSGNKTNEDLNIQDKLISGQNIKTINNQPILGSGNINIEGGSGEIEESIYIGTTEPTNGEKIWIDTSGNSSNNNSYLKTLKVGILGDSITYGAGVNHETQPYPALLKKDFGEVINYGVSSTLIGTGYNSNAMCVRYTGMVNDLDVVIVMGGTNDYAFRANMGTAEETFGDPTSTNTDTFYGALNTLMSGLIAKYPGKQIFFCTPIHIKYGNYNSDGSKTNGKSLYDYRNAIIEMGMRYSIPVIDTMVESRMDIAHNAAERTMFTTDGCHPSVRGHIRLHDVILQAIKNRLGEMDNPTPIVLKYKDNTSNWKILSDRGIAPQSSLTVSSISAVYTQGDTVVHTDTPLNSLKDNLVVTATYSDDSTSTVIPASYTLSGTLTEGTSTISVIYSGKTASFTVNVTSPVSLSSIKATYTQSGVVYSTDSLNSLKDNLVVTGTYSDSSTATISSNDYSLSGTLSVGVSTITVTYQDKTDTFNVTVSEAPTLVSITATYTQGSSVITENTNLEDLKNDLVVTATYSNSDTRTVTDYTLSGTLVEGTSTITVTYEGKTDTFNVTVSGSDIYQDDDELYIISGVNATLNNDILEIN